MPGADADALGGIHLPQPRRNTVEDQRTGDNAAQAGRKAAAAGGSKAAAGGVSVTQNIYANETSYTGQQKLAAREMRMLAREMSW